MARLRFTEHFADRAINVGRQDELDVVKGLAIIFMVWCHVLRELGGDTSSIPGRVVDSVLGGPFAAPMFMICMGVGICYSTKDSPRTLARRGAGLVAMGYSLNAVRYTIPETVAYLATGNDQIMHGWVDKLMQVDILQFAGLAFLAFAAAKKIDLGMREIIAAALLMSVAGTLLNSIKTNVHLLDLVLGLFWKTQPSAYFTLFHWFALPVAGLALGKLMMRCTDKTAVYTKVIWPALVGGLVIEAAATAFGYGLIDETTEFFYMNLANICFLVCLAIFWFGINHAWRQRFPCIRVGTLHKMSKNINQIYCIHWVIIGVISVVIASGGTPRGIGFVPATALACAILTFSVITADRYTRIKKSLKRRALQAS